MLTSISPVGEHARGQRWHVTVAFHLLGATLGGTVTGAVAGGAGQLALGWIGDATATAVLLAVAIVAAAVDGRTGRLPMWRRQVDEDWLTRYRGWVYGFGFGVQLGAAFSTFVTSTIVHLTFAAALLTRSWTAGAAVGAAFGVVRALPVAATHRVRSPAALAALHRRLQGLQPRAARAARVCSGVAAVTLVAGVVL